MSGETYCMDMCRACMKNDGVLLSMYDDEAIGRNDLPHKLAELTSIQIDRFDGLPTMLCAKCAYRTNTFYEFKQQVQETEKKLRMMFKNHTYITKREVLSEEDCQDSTMQMNELLELNSSYDQKFVHGVHTLEYLMTKTKDEVNKDKQQVEIDALQLDTYNIDKKKSNLQLNDVLSDPIQQASEDQTNIHSVKTELPEEILKMLKLQQLDYTIMYIPKSMMESTVENSMTSYPEEKDIGNDQEIFVPVILDKQENIEEILSDMCISNPEESKIATKIKHTLDNSIQIQNRSNKMNSKSSSHIKELSKQENSNESDSDYFIDPKDNILGSLNDTITRIKELREGNAIQYQCTLCLQNYDKLTGVLLHTIDNHIPSSGPFFCVVCEKDCESHRELRAHAKTHTGRFPYSCFICNKAYTMKRYLKRHMACHTDFPRHRCPKCGIRFKVKSELESHVTTHVHGAPYACSQCPRVFNHKGNYKRHLISHLDPHGLHLPKYPCNICGKRFLNNRTLETHKRVHTGEKPFSCEICGRSFSQQGNLLNHARIHSNPRSYTCEICGRRFNQRATLNDHRLLHTGEKPHVCNVCGVAFTFSAALRRHMWTHMDGKPFGCETCGARFIGKYDLRRHMQVHTNRPRAKRKRSVISKSIDSLQEESKEANFDRIEEPESETVLIEEVFLPQDVTQVIHQVESEKENVDALFNLIQYDS